MTDPSHRSGRFVLRTGAPLHARLSAAAATAGLSLNEYCVRALGAAEVGPAYPNSFADLTARVVSQLGADLVGIAIFGSVARGTAGPSSDLDVLIVCGPGLPIKRSLYTPWDASPIDWQGHPVEPHFLRLPTAGNRVSGLWAEVAMEGVVIFDPELRLSLALMDIRHRLFAGELVRRTAQGQTYWSAA